MVNRSSSVSSDVIVDMATGEPLPPLLHDLAERARQAQALAYAPYSRFPVGAALRSRMVVSLSGPTSRTPRTG